MKTNNEKNWTAADWHPEDEDLLMSLDGELEAKEHQLVRSHLDSCWSCRSRAERLQAGISAFIDYHETVLTPLVKNSGGWNDFNNYLQNAVKESKQNLSWFRLLINRFGSFQFNLDNVALIRGLTASVLIIAIIGAFLFFGREQTVSAAEILGKVNEAQNLKTEAVFQPVVYQKVLLKKQINGAETDALTLESWNDIHRLRTRTALAENNERKFITEKVVFGKKHDIEETLAPQVLLELKEILSKNRMNTVQPLSAQSFAKWRDGANLQAETVEKSINADGVEILTIRTTAAQPVEKGLITNAEFVVRTRDWHPVKLAFEVQNDTIQSYEFVETGFEIVSLSNLNPNILPPVETLTAVNTTPKPSPSPSASESPEKVEEANVVVNANATPATSKTLTPTPAKSEKPVAATTEQELEVMRILQDAKADLGEQISVERGADGKIYVSGIVESAERKMELVHKLQSVADNKKVKINIRTISEAVAQQKQKPPPKSNATPEELSVTVDDETQDFAPELRRAFGNEESIRRFSSQMVSRSRQTMSHAFALRNLINQFKADKVQNLSPEARAKWLNLIKARANSYKAEAVNLRGELQKVFSNSGGGKSVVITNDVELFRAVERLFALALANDRAIRSAFASGGINSVAAVRSAQFWQSLAEAEALTASIATAK